MSTTTLAALCLLSPLVAFFFGFTVFRKRAAVSIGLALVGAVASAVASVLLLIEGPQAEPVTLTWLVAGGTDVGFGFLLDAPSLLMGVVVAGIALCIQVYSLGYMADDEGKGRFFAFLSLFAWSMLSFVYAPSLLQGFIFWELVGLASFLLIGFWYQKPSAVAAAKKAFIMTRIGDTGFFIGLLMLLGATGTLDIVTINQASTIAGIDPSTLSAITLLLFLGVVGKSAQFPLHTWLPDAMEGPTPVSALLHSATMVAAGVFLFARFHPLFMAAPGTLDVVLAVAAFTAVMSSTMALATNDMKRVLAFSSISQLGFMLMGLAAGSLFAGVFHLTTHAVFKALLFLCAGAFIHHHGTNDMVAMGRDGARKLRVAVLGLVVGGGALAGIPPLAGFFSKEHVLHALSGRPVIASMALGAAFLTAYYTFRMVFLLTRPNPAGALQPEQAAGALHGAGHHAHHGTPLAMAAPIVLLTVLAAGLGFGGDAIARLLGEEVVHPSVAAMLPAIGIALAGVALAWWDFGRAGAPQTGFVARVPAVQRFFARQWGLNELYDRVFVRGAKALAALAFATETRGMDGGALGIATATGRLGRIVSLAHGGRFQIYVSAAVLAVGLLSFYLLGAP